MNNVLLNYLLTGFLKKFLIMVGVFYCFGLILNLLEEVEFFKNTSVNFIVPLMLTSLFIPSMIIKLLPFIIFISSMWFMTKIRNNKDLLTLKVFGFSNMKIFFVLALFSFALGWVILFAINPITSSMATLYEKTKSNYSRDIDHLVNFNRNGLWIKEEFSDKKRIISAERPEGFNLINIRIFHIDKKSKLVEKIFADEANIENNTWVLTNAKIFNLKDGNTSEKVLKKYEINSVYNYNKINNLFKNFDTLSFLEIVTKKNNLLENGYSEIFLNESLHKMLSIPFFLFFMTSLASIFTMNTLKKGDNLKLILTGLLTCVLTFYFKDLSLALGQTDRIPLIMAVWAPVIALGFFTFVGVLQINEK